MLQINRPTTFTESTTSLDRGLEPEADNRIKDLKTTLLIKSRHKNGDRLYRRYMDYMIVLCKPAGNCVAR